MASPLASPAAPFGRVLTAMVTPFTRDGDLDLDAAQKVASYLVDQGNDGLVVSGTTGESPTTTNEEDGRLLTAVLEAVGDRATIVAGVGTNDTRHSSALAAQAARIGAHGLLVVTPYYNKPPQAGIVAHMNTVAAAGGGLPVMVYDIPGRSGVQIAESSYLELTENPLIVGLKDAVGDLERGAWLLHQTGIRIYSGDDALNLGWLAIGASGMVSTVGHVAAGAFADLVRAVDAGDLSTARAINNRMLPVVRALMTTSQGAITAKVALELLGVLEHSTVRSPLCAAPAADRAIVRAGLVASGLLAA